MTQAHMVHHIEGKRVRVRVPTKRHDATYFHKVQARLHTIDGVQARVDPKAASVLIHYSGSSAELCTKLVEAGVSELLDVELGPMAELTDGLPLPAKLVLVTIMLGVGVYQTL